MSDKAAIQQNYKFFLLSEQHRTAGAGCAGANRPLFARPVALQKGVVSKPSPHLGLELSFIISSLLCKLCNQELPEKIFRREIFNAKRLRLAMPQAVFFTNLAALTVGKRCVPCPGGHGRRESSHYKRERKAIIKRTSPTRTMRRLRRRAQSRRS